MPELLKEFGTFCKDNLQDTQRNVAKIIGTGTFGLGGGGPGVVGCPLPSSYVYADHVLVLSFETLLSFADLFVYKGF